MLYKFNKDDIESSERASIVTPADVRLSDEDIHEFLISKIHEVVSDGELMPVSQPQKRQAEPDFLALDQAGTLYIFKVFGVEQGEASLENFLQMLKYGRKFGGGYEQLNEMCKTEKTLDQNLQDGHKAYFDLYERLPKERFNYDQQVFVLVVNGMDSDTIENVIFWSNNGLDVRISPYRIYNIDNNVHIQFDTFNTEGHIVPEEYINPEEGLRYFVVNTNSNEDNPLGSWKEMVGDGKKGKAEAYGGNAKKIKKLLKGDIIYLYHTGIGIVAKGEATSGPIEEEEWECFVRLQFKWAITNKKDLNERAVSATEFNKRYSGNTFTFRGTMFALYGDKFKVIDEIAKKKGH